MDKLDRGMLLELMKDSRAPVAALSRKLHASREVCNYRLARLEKSGTILKFVTEIDAEKLGYSGAAVFINIKRGRSAAFESFLRTCPYVSWVAELSGIWNFGLSIYAKSSQKLDEEFYRICEKFREDIIDYRFLLLKENDFFYEKYFGAMPAKRKETATGHEIDSKDRLLLKLLAKNSRMGAVELAKKAGITPQTAGQRIKMLEKGGVIRKYSILVDVSKLGLYQYGIFISSKDAGAMKKLSAYLHQHPKVSYLAAYIGSTTLEFGAVVENPYGLRDILQDIGEAFPESKVAEISLFQKEFVSVGLPDCVFD
ncbi:putative HTH-type transcriptional regulator [uncultured archaeon]|nr:putative HTH-type transcriptional regulator [uncultured archaeon]